MDQCAAIIRGTIIIPLTDERAQNCIQGLHYSYEKEGPIWQEERTLGGYTVQLIGNDPREGYDENLCVAYTSGGIGYNFYACHYGKVSYDPPHEPYYASAMEILLTFMPDSE